MAYIMGSDTGGGGKTGSKGKLTPDKLTDNKEKPTRTESKTEEKGGKRGGSYTAPAAPVSAGAYTAASVSGRDGSPVADTYYEDMRDDTRRRYEEQIGANDAAADKAAARAGQLAEEQRAALDAEYQGVNRQLYRDYKQQERLLPQQMAARGYSGGLTESSRLRLRNGYEEGLGQNERARIGQRSKIDAALAQQEYETRAAADRANVQARQNMYASLAQLRSEQHQQTRADAQERAARLAAAGDYSGYRALGYSEGEIAYLSNMWGAMNPLLAENQSYGHFSDEGRVKNTAAWQVANYLRKIKGADAAVDYIAEEMAAGNLTTAEADDLRKYLRNEG